MKIKENNVSNKSLDIFPKRYVRYRNSVLRGYINNRKSVTKNNKRKNTCIFDNHNFQNNFTINFNFFEKRNHLNEEHDFITEAISPIKSFKSPSKILRENDDNKSIHNISIYKLANDSNEGLKGDADSIISNNEDELLNQKNFKNIFEKRPSKNSNGISHTNNSLNVNSNTDSSSNSNKYKRLLGFKNTTTINSNHNSSKDKEEFTIDKFVNETFNCIDPLSSGKKAFKGKIKINKKLETAFGRNFIALKSLDDLTPNEEKNNIEENFEEYVATENSDIEDEIIKNDLIKNLELDKDEKIFEFEKNDLMNKIENVIEDKLNLDDKPQPLSIEEVEDRKNVVLDSNALFSSELTKFSSIHTPNGNPYVMKKGEFNHSITMETNHSRPDDFNSFSNWINVRDNFNQSNTPINNFFLKCPVGREIDFTNSFPIQNKNYFPNLNNNNNNIHPPINPDRNINYNIYSYNNYFFNFYSPPKGIENHTTNNNNYSSNIVNNPHAANFSVNRNNFTRSINEPTNSNTNQDVSNVSNKHSRVSFKNEKNESLTKGFNRNFYLNNNNNPNTIINVRDNQIKEKSNKIRQKHIKVEIDYKKIDILFKLPNSGIDFDYIFTVLKEQKVCRYFQKKIEDNQKDLNLSKSLFRTLLEENRIFEIILDQFGNYVIQKFLEYVYEDKDSMMLLFSRLSENLFFFCIHQFGTRVIQKALDLMRNTFYKIEDYNITNLLNHLISMNILNLIKDSNGNHVFTKILILYTKLSNEDKRINRNQFIYNEIYKNVIEINKLKQGGNVMQRVIECANEEQRHTIICKVLDNLELLINDEYANFFIQYIISMDIQMYNKYILNFLKNNFVKYSKKKYSSNVIDKCLFISENKNTNFSRVLLDELINGKYISELIVDQFGNYVIQKALEVCSKRELEFFVKEIKLNLNSILSTSYGRRIIENIKIRNGDIFKK